MGADGMNDAGRIGFVIRGTYDSTATYDFLDTVYFEGSSYVAKKATIGNEPKENDEYWQILAKVGSVGSNGSMIYSGTSAPSSSLGLDGDIYFQYS